MNLEDLEARITSLEANVHGDLAHRLRRVEDRFDTLNTPVWKRIVFRADGWGPWHTLRDAPRWRPWRRFWRS